MLIFSLTFWYTINGSSTLGIRDPGDSGPWRTVTVGWSGIACGHQNRLLLGPGTLALCACNLPCYIMRRLPQGKLALDLVIVYIYDIEVRSGIRVLYIYIYIYIYKE